MIDKLLIKLRRYDKISEEEEQALRAAAGETIRCKRGTTIVRAKTELSFSATASKTWRTDLARPSSWPSPATSSTCTAFS
jgi:hypothetical protein